MPNSGVQCGECGRPLDEDRNEPDRPPCPDCGSTRRAYGCDGETQAGFKERLGVKVKDPVLTGRAKYRSEQISGDELNHSTGKWVKKIRVIDRQNDKYLEWVTDAQTGEALHRCEQPLSEHYGHGSAKTPPDSSLAKPPARDKLENTGEIGL
jgi:hypothetical protein